MNPFAQFSVKSSIVHVPAKPKNSAGWIHTKKRGRDDEEIARDRARVIEARQKAKAASKPGFIIKKALKTGISKKKRNHRPYSSSEDDDDDGSMDGFIVDDDEDLDEYEESSPEKLSQKSRKSTMKSFTIPRLTKPPILDITSTTSPSSSSVSLSPTDNHSLKLRHKMNRDSLDKPDSSETDFSLNKKKDKVFKSKEYCLSLENSDSDRDDFDFHQSKCNKVKSNTLASKKKVNIFSDDFEDDHTPDIHAVKPSTWNEDDFADEDEAVAMVYAMEESLKTCKSNGQKKIGGKRLYSAVREKDTSKPVVIKQDNKKSDITLFEDENSSDSHEDVLEVEDYKDGADNDIQVILKAVNVLSSQILSRMMRGGSNNESVVSDIMPGLIVDGALALTSMDVLPVEKSFTSECDIQGSSASDRWISQEDIVTVCPNLKLADYQLVGVNWLWFINGLTCDLSAVGLRCHKNLSTKVSSILADEMGLGKTIQTIAFLAWLKKYNSTKDPHLIVVPASVLANWEREFRLFCPQMVLVKYHGTVDERNETKNQLREFLKDKGGRTQLDLVLTTYSYFSSEKSDDRVFLKKIKWNYLIVDEAHCLKNQNGARYKNMNSLNTQRRLLLTGTPVQNRPAELASLLCFLMPIFADSNSRASSERDDDSKTSAIIEYFKSFESKSKMSEVNSENASMIQHLKQLLAPFILRRKKEDVMSQLIPPKTRKVEFVPFDAAVQNTYESILASNIQSKDKGDYGNIEDISFQKHLFTSLRKAANHPLLLRTRFTSAADVAHLSKHLHLYGYFGYHETCTVQLVQKELENFSDFDIHCAALTLIEEKSIRRQELDRYILDDDTLFLSPKFQRLKNLLPSLIADEHRILIFSQWTRCLDLLESLMDSLDIHYLRLDGQTSISERQVLIDKFNSDSSIPVFLLSTRAGGMGINLTSADTCILHDLDFNPFNDLQAEDRCHRIGQKRPVTVIKMITKGTVDEDIYNMQERKTLMNAAILESSKKNDSKAEDEDVKTVLKLAVNRFLHKHDDTEV